MKKIFMLSEAIKRREEFLESHSEFRNYQRDLDVALSGVDDPMLRFSILLGKISKNMEKVNKVLEGVK